MNSLGLIILVGIMCDVILGYRQVDVKSFLDCVQRESDEHPVYDLKLPNLSVKKTKVKAQMKMCSTPSDENYCSDLQKSGWLNYGDCSYDGDIVRCDMNLGETNWLRQTLKSYLRVFVYNDSSLMFVSKKFQYPPPTGCYCQNRQGYLPTSKSFHVVVGGKDSVHVKVVKPEHMRKGLNARKYDFRFHRSASLSQTVFPASNTNPLLFDIHNLTKCGSYAFQVSILPHYLKCKLLKGYYVVERFTFDPEGGCEKKSSFNVHLIYAIALPIIIAGLAVIVITVKRNCATIAGHQSSFSTVISSPAFEHPTDIQKTALHVYDSIETEELPKVESNMEGDHV